MTNTNTAAKSLAAQYADSVCNSIWSDYELGYTFGLDDDGRELSEYDYLDDALDVEYHVNAYGEYMSANIVITVGGPHAYIDTRSGLLVVSWDTTETRGLPDAFTAALDCALFDSHETILNK
jgi:hypothetical protein